MKSRLFIFKYFALSNDILHPVV